MLFYLLTIIALSNALIVRFNYQDPECGIGTSVDRFSTGVCYGDKQFNQFQLWPDQEYPHLFFKWCTFKGQFCVANGQCEIVSFNMCYGINRGPHLQASAKFVQMADDIDPHLENITIIGNEFPSTVSPFLKPFIDLHDVKSENVGCSQNGEKCIDNSDCCYNPCSPTSCSGGTCIGSMCKGYASACISDCECCSGNCEINEVNPGACG